ncbi:MAG: 3-deoxy-manno-octulosonate cytidylyltransferase [Thauera sp.]|jgi:3-deoxy-manno-octulosonate cytidylyltransferase (CMP-KDO synthetase)|nr:3-deoxy-manno-octulosonate cytidylyltransferase [Thauera sp.]
MKPFVVVIPARFASTRLPGKPLLDIGGQPMIQRVWARASLSAAARVIVATDDARIAEVVAGFGGEVCLTRASHESGTDRLQEVAAALGFADDQIIVNVQGDEPMIPPAVIDQVAQNLAGSDRAGIATLVKRIHDRAEVFNPNAVKVVVDNTSHALYFSRASIPYDRDGFASSDASESIDEGWLRHIGIYAYRANFLHRFITWPLGRLERLEKLEQLRALENGVAIHVAEACADIPVGVDTAADLERVRAAIVRGVQ